MKNAKNNNANLYSNFSPRLFKSYFLTGGAMAPPGPPLESPMATGTNSRQVRLRADR